MADPATLVYTIDTYAELSCKVDYSLLEGPGKHLMGGVHLGDTIARETFVAQFVRDIATAAGINPIRVLVTEIAPAGVHFSWSATSAIVLFRILHASVVSLPAAVTHEQVMLDLTQQGQDPTSQLYDLEVTQAIDARYGVVAVKLDASLKLGYSINTVGGPAVIDGYYLNQGSESWCALGAAASDAAVTGSAYCQWEDWFRADLTTALGLALSRVQVLVITAAGKDAVEVTFRILPPPLITDLAVAAALTLLLAQVADVTSALYAGQVTLRTDMTWGVSGIGGVPRTQGPLSGGLVYTSASPAVNSPYERCKATHACNRAQALYSPAAAAVAAATPVARPQPVYSTQAFVSDAPYSANLWADFEDWRAGSFPWAYQWAQDADAVAAGTATTDPRSTGGVRGAHFNPFALDSGGHAAVPFASAAQGSGSIAGLVLDTQQKDRDLAGLEAEIVELTAERDWMAGAAFDLASMAAGAALRSRYDVTADMQAKIDTLNTRISAAEAVKLALTNSQCGVWGTSAGCGYTPYPWDLDADGSLAAAATAAAAPCPCALHFDTSGATPSMTGAVSAAGTVLLTPAGTEVAVWSFEQVRLGPEVRITVSGQRPLALLSRSALLLNTTVTAEPATLGGFRGGGGIARAPTDDPHSDTHLDLTLLDLVTANSAGLPLGQPSNNLNGPGAASQRYYAFTVTARGTAVPEQQRLCTSASSGQTLRGCLRLALSAAGAAAGTAAARIPQERSTQCFPHDITAAALQRELQLALNEQDPLDPRPLAYKRDSSVDSSSWTLGVGAVAVSAPGAARDGQGGRCWDIEFPSFLGDLPQLSVNTSALTGGGAAAVVTTLQNGTALGGHWQLRLLDRDDGYVTPKLRFDATAEEVSAALLLLPGIDSATVERTDPAAECADGLCSDPSSPQALGGGYTWTVEFATQDGNVAPTWPLDTASSALEGAAQWPQAVSYLTGAGASLTLTRGFAGAPNAGLALYDAQQPVSISCGGAGGSYGGAGGRSSTGSAAGAVYGDAALQEDLLGGSGGACAGLHPYEIHRMGETFYGGAGGGAIELVAANDLTIGVLGGLHVDGAAAAAGGWHSGAGGGSGGSLLLAAGGSLLQQGTLTAKGGSAGTAARTAAADAGGGGGGSGGRIALFGQSVLLDSAAAAAAGAYSTGVDVSGGACAAAVAAVATDPTATTVTDWCAGSLLAGEGTLWVDAPYGSSMHVLTGAAAATDVVQGAQGTGASLLVQRYSSGLQFPTTVSGGTAAASLLYDGPDIALAAEADGSPAKPERVSFYVRIAKPAAGASSSSSASGSASSSSEQAAAAPLDWGAVVALIPPPSAGAAPASSSSNLFPEPLAAALAVSLTGSSGMLHGPNCDPLPGPGSGGGTLLQHVHAGVWYGVDVRLRWAAGGLSGFYSVRVDGVQLASEVPFSAPGAGIARLGVYALSESAVSIDEVYAGPDFTMGFQCPVSTAQGLQQPSGQQAATGWAHVMPPLPHSSTHPMQRHESFLSESAAFSDVNNAELAPFDGDGHADVTVDAYLHDGSVGDTLAGGGSSGSSSSTSQSLAAGALLRVPSAASRPSRAAQQVAEARGGADALWQTGTAAAAAAAAAAQQSAGGWGTGSAGGYYWYSERDDALAAAAHSRPELSRGVGACSSDDMVHWRFEGIVLHGAHVADSVEGGSTGQLALQQPRVLKGDSSVPGASQYAMWGVVQDPARTLGMAGVATAEHPGGPFQFRRSFYPDGNDTYDQTVYTDPADGTSYLTRTYYATTEYVLPTPVMQPIWEAVKTASGATDYGLSYHRAFYSKDYDDYHDIFMQRWRLEDVPWKVLCVDRITQETREAVQGVFDATGAYCTEPKEYKVIIGQGSPVVTSRFKNPDDPANSFWKPSSVPSVRAQPWQNNYKDSTCGLRNMDDNYSRDDVELATRPATPDRSQCTNAADGLAYSTNVADNPIHGTPPDKLIGTLRRVEARTARYVAVSKLTPDLLQTTGQLTAVEGQLEQGDPLSAVGTVPGIQGAAAGFGWSFAGTDLRSTFAPVLQAGPGLSETAEDSDTRMHQYEERYNDRARYSLACVLDGDCPVNFRDQITVGNV